MNYLIQIVKSVFILLVVFGLHLVLLSQLLQWAPVETHKKPAEPIIVNLITPPPVKPAAVSAVPVPPAVVQKPLKAVSKSVTRSQPVKKITAKKTPRVKRRQSVKKTVTAKKRKKTQRVKRRQSVKKTVTAKKTQRVKRKPVQKATSTNRSINSTKVSRAKSSASTVDAKKEKNFPSLSLSQAQSAGIRSNSSSSAKPSYGQRSQSPTRRSHQRSATGTGITRPPLYRPAYLHNPYPAYPRISKRRGEQGTVLLRVKVTPNGRAALVKIKQSSGFKRLDKAARQAVTGWRFVPAKKAGQSVTDWVIIPIVFKLK
jgi:protein TonB